MLSYHSVLPQNKKDTYTEFDIVDFELDFAGRKMLGNTLRIKANVKINSTGDTLILGDDDVNIDQFVGGHSFFDSITTEAQTVGVIENLVEYPRYVRMSGEAMLDKSDLFNSEHLCEMKFASKEFGRSMLAGGRLMEVVTTGNAGNDQTGLDFSIKPMFCLNRISTNDNTNMVSFTKTGSIRISLKLARNANVLFGSNVTADYNYKLENLELCYTSIPDDGKSNKVMMRTKLNIKQSMNSKFANISTKVPAVCNAVSCSFQQQSREGQVAFNSCQTERVPNITELQFIFNDSQDQYVTYQIKDLSEIAKRYLESFADTGHNSTQVKYLMNNEGFGIGLNFKDNIDLSRQKFNVQMSSDITNNQPYIIYLYFHSMMEM